MAGRMIRPHATFALLLLLIAAPLSARGPVAPVRVTLQTSAGPILVELAMDRAPITAGNFLRYVDEKRFDGTVFYRAAPTRINPARGFIQGGIRHSLRRSLPPIAHEPTSRTGLKHIDGALSMARGEPGSAMGDFFITAGAAPAMDAKPGNPGYAVYGRVVGGMAVVRRILAGKTYPDRGAGAMKGQMLIAPVAIVTARRAH
jgi:peptidyl-prolyl cis-trans isomerase A (cyclophilin A)